MPPRRGGRVAIFTDFRGWHEAELRRAADVLALDSVLLSLKSCRFGTTGAGCHGLRLPGFEDALPDAVFVRFIPGGSFEQVTWRLDVLHALSACGVPVYNSARVIERTVDKAMTSFLLARAELPTPEAWSLESIEQAREIVRTETRAGRSLVLKPLFGSRGRDLRKLDRPDDLPAADEYEGVYYLQSFVEPSDQWSRDWRVLVVGQRAIAAMERRSRHWITNRARGGECLAAVLDGGIGALAEQAAAVVGADYAGVDLIRDRDGRLLVLEVNGIPAWQGLQSVCEIDIAGALIDDLRTRIDVTAASLAS